MNRVSPCEYCGAPLPEGVDKHTRRVRSAHFNLHAQERRKEAQLAQADPLEPLTRMQEELGLYGVQPAQAERECATCLHADKSNQIPPCRTCGLTSGEAFDRWEPAAQPTQGEAPSEREAPLQFVCQNGCGVCGVKLRDFVTHATQKHEGAPWVTVASEPQVVSTCCGSPVEVWDERTGDVTGEVRAALASQPQAEAVPSGAVARVRRALADRQFREATDMEDLLRMAANVIAEDGAIIERHRQKQASQPQAVDAEDGVLREIADEVARAMAKFPTWPTDPLHALAVLGEEFGELTKDVLQMTYEPHKTTADNVRKEATQTAAMALRFLASLDRYEYRRGEQHAQSAVIDAARRAGGAG